MFHKHMDWNLEKRLDQTSEVQFIAHSKELNNIYQMDKIDMVVFYLAGVVESTEVDEITQGENREQEKGAAKN